MKRPLLLLLILVTVFIFSSCAQETQPDTSSVEKDKGIFGSVLSSDESQAKPAAVVSGGSAVVVADFNSGSKPSNIGGDFGAWDKDPIDFTQTCVDSFDSVHKYGSRGFGMKLDYDVDSQNPAYNGFWMKLNDLNAVPYKNLVFYVKGDENAGFTTVFKIELKSADGEVGRFYVTGIESDWQRISIALKQFHGITSFDKLAEFVIVFEDRMATNKDGIIYIDDIQFTR